MYLFGSLAVLWTGANISWLLIKRSKVKEPALFIHHLLWISSPLPLLVWGLSASDVEAQEGVIGQGEFGEVHPGTYRGTHQVAVKTIHESKHSSAAVASFLREATVMTYVYTCVLVDAQS